MTPIGLLRLILCAATTLTEAARLTGSVTDEFSHALDNGALSNVTAPVCGSNPEPKDYFFDLPGGSVDNSAAVRLIRNPSDPWLEVSRGAVWNVKADVDGGGKIIPSSILFEARDKMNQHKRPQQYNLRSDMLYMKKRVENGVMWVEVKLKGCGAGKGPMRPGRPAGAAPPVDTPGGNAAGATETLVDDAGPPAAKSAGKGKSKGGRKSRGDAKGKGKAKGTRGSRRKGGGAKGGGGKSRGRRSRSLLEEEEVSIDSGDDDAIAELYEADEDEGFDSDDAAFVELYEDDAEDDAWGHVSSDDDVAAIDDDSLALLEEYVEAEDHVGTAKGRGKKGSRGKKGALSRPAGGAGPMRPSRPTGMEDCKPLTFAHGTFYPQNAVKDALTEEMKKGKAGGWILPSQTVKNVSMAPALGKGIFGVLGFSTLGVLAVVPVTWVGQEQGLVAGPIGAAIGGIVSGGIAAYRSWKSAPKTASEKLYEKLYCLTKVKTCNGEACFKQCHDSEGNEAIVPTHSEPGDGIRC